MNDSLAPAAQPAERVLRFGYDGTRKAVAEIAVTNALLTVATLGIYRFWAKTRLRRYIWGRLELAGDRLEYSGTGKELLLGFLVALLVLVPLVVIDYLAASFLPPDSSLLGVEQIAYALIIWFLVNLALFRARRYRLTRTRWRGLRFTQTGSAVSYAFSMMAWQFLVGITLFLASPFYRTARQKYLVDNTRFGSHELRFLGQGSDLFGAWFVAWLLMIPTLGLSYVWYRVREFNYFASKTRFRGLRAVANLPTGKVMGIVFVYLLILVLLMVALIALLAVLTPGLLVLFGGPTELQISTSNLGLDSLIFVALLAAFAIVSGTVKQIFFMHPLLGVVMASLSLKGRVEFDVLARARDEAPDRGEGLFDALDVGEF